MQQQSSQSCQPWLNNLYLSGYTKMLTIASAAACWSGVCVPINKFLHVWPLEMVSICTHTYVHIHVHISIVASIYTSMYLSRVEVWCWQPNPNHVSALCYYFVVFVFYYYFLLLLFLFCHTPTNKMKGASNACWSLRRHASVQIYTYVCIWI